MAEMDLCEAVLVGLAAAAADQRPEKDVTSGGSHSEIVMQSLSSGLNGAKDSSLSRDTKPEDRPEDGHGHTMDVSDSHTNGEACRGSNVEDNSSELAATIPWLLPVNSLESSDDRSAAFRDSDMLIAKTREKDPSHPGRNICVDPVPVVNHETDTGSSSGRPLFTQQLPQLVFTSSQTFGGSCTRGCAWSPAGDRLAAAGEDARLRLYNFPSTTEWDSDQDARPDILIKETEMIYDFAWRESDILTTGRYQPIHLRDTVTGGLKATYSCYNHLDEVTHAFSLCPVPGEDQLLCGLKSQVREFDLNLPGRVCRVLPTCEKRGRGQQVGIISSLAISPNLSMYAAGSYSRTVGVYSRAGSQLYLLAGHRGGVTQVAFSEDGVRLYSGGRKDEAILCWDLRSPGKVLHTLSREASTNQRIQFVLLQNRVLSGGTDGCVRVWDQEGTPLAGYLLHPDCVNGVAVHPSEPLLATASGQRQVRLKTMNDGDNDDDDGDGDSDSDSWQDNSVRVWRFSSDCC